MRRIFIQVPMAIFWLIYHQVLKVTQDLLIADWSTGTERDPFPAISGDQQSLQQITSLGYCWSGPDLSGWPQRWRKKKIIHFIPDPINNSDLNTNKFQAHLPSEWLPFMILMLPPSFLLVYPLATCPNVTSMKDAHTPHRALQGHHTDRWVGKELPGKPGKIALIPNRVFC